MPSLLHGDFEVTEIVPIGKYICRVANRYDLLGANLQDEVTMDNFIIKLFYIRKTYLEILSSVDPTNEETFAKESTEKITALKEKMITELIEWLRTKEWYMGYLTLVDFLLYEILYCFRGYHPNVFNDPALMTYMGRFEGIPQINKYFKSGKCKYKIALNPELEKRWKGRKPDSVAFGNSNKPPSKPT